MSPISCLVDARRWTALVVTALCLVMAGAGALRASPARLGVLTLGSVREAPLQGLQDGLAIPRQHRFPIDCQMNTFQVTSA